MVPTGTHRIQLLWCLSLRLQDSHLARAGEIIKRSRLAMKLRMLKRCSLWSCVSRRTIASAACGFLLAVSGVAPATGSSGEAAPSAIVLFDGANGPEYIQLTAVTLNGKGVARVCDGLSKLNKSIYGNLSRIFLKRASSLDRGSDGLLTLVIADKRVCVVPENLGFDKKSEFTIAEAADRAVIQGSPVVPSTPSAFELKPNTEVVFVQAPDVELAEFLRAKRAGSIKSWEACIAHAPSSRFLADARAALAGLYEDSAESAFAKYQQTRATGKLDVAALRDASTNARAAAQTSLGFKPAAKLTTLIEHELNVLLEDDRAKLEDFRRALEQQTPGYNHLASARLNLDHLAQVRSDYAPVVNLRNEVAGEQGKLDATLVNAESIAATGRHDDAIKLLGSYLAFSTEVPRIDALIEGAYQYHLKRGQQASADQEWEQACTEFRKAAALRPDRKEADTSLADASAQLSAQHDQQAANIALLQSKDFANKGQIVEAYNVLADLPDKPRVLVAPQLAAMGRDYVGAAVRRAQKLQEVHVPIKVRADEDAILEAYMLLNRASSLSGDPAILVKRDFLSSKISAYYVDQANRYLEKPSAASIGIGWLYLQQAQHYGVTNLEGIRDRMSQFAPLYQRRARLSVGVVLRDQTSRNEPGFADQIADSIASGLDSSGIPIEIVRKPSDNDLQPNFILMGNILEHRVVKNSSLESPVSKYRVGTHEAKNPVWLQARSELDSALRDLSSARNALLDAQSHHRKKDIAADTDSVEKAQKHVDELQHALETTEQSRTEAIVESYHYTKKKVDVSALIGLTLHIVDRTGKPVGAPVEVHKTNQKSALLVQDVKPEDVEGITNEGVEPNELQFLTDLEIEARNSVVEAVMKKASELPGVILGNARMASQQGDIDGAAEQYILYLNSTTDNRSVERSEALRFMHDRFNLDSSAFANGGRLSSQGVTAVSSALTR
jgi:hypothetical protein